MSVKSMVKSVLSNDKVRRVFHAFWQAAGGVILAGIFAAHSSHDVKLLATGAFAAGLSAVKALLVGWVNK